MSDFTMAMQVYITDRLFIMLEAVTLVYIMAFWSSSLERRAPQGLLLYVILSAFGNDFCRYWHGEWILQTLIKFTIVMRLPCIWINVAYCMHCDITWSQLPIIIKHVEVHSIRVCYDRIPAVGCEFKTILWTSSFNDSMHWMASTPVTLNLVGRDWVTLCHNFISVAID